MKTDNTIEIKGVKFEYDNEGYVKFGNVARSLLKQQCQYASRYADDLDKDYPNFGKGLRIQGTSGSYHRMKIHKDDIETFVDKVMEYRNLVYFTTEESFLNNTLKVFSVEELVKKHDNPKVYRRYHEYFTNFYKDLSDAGANTGEDIDVSFNRLSTFKKIHWLNHFNQFVVPR